MNRLRNPRLPALMFGVLGILAMVLRRGVYTLGVDGKGLLIPGHPLQIGLWVMFGAAILLAVVLSGNIPSEASRLHSLGDFLGAAGVALSLRDALAQSSTVLDGLHMAAAVVAAGALVLAGIRRQKGAGASMLYGIVCLFFALHLVTGYRQWSAHPQVLDYFFQLLGSIGAMLYAYFRCDGGHLRLRRITALLGAFCCLAAASGETGLGLHLGTGLWMLLTLDAEDAP